MCIRDRSKALKDQGFSGYTDIREQNRINYLSLYGGLFFLGIFLGTLFLLATVLIIYYKQVSEGYEDKERFEICLLYTSRCV